MGRTIEKVIVKSYGDMLKANEGLIRQKDIRSVDVSAIVDTGATYLCLPPSIITQLGLLYSHTGRVKTANGNVERRIFAGAEITIQDRNVQMEVMESDANTPPLIGFLILEALDFVVNPKTQGLMGNPEHDGKWIIDLY